MKKPRVFKRWGGWWVEWPCWEIQRHDTDVYSTWQDAMWRANLEARRLTHYDTIF